MHIPKQWLTQREQRAPLKAAIILDKACLWRGWRFYCTSPTCNLITRYQFSKKKGKDHGGHLKHHFSRNLLLRSVHDPLKFKKEFNHTEKSRPVFDISMEFDGSTIIKGGMVYCHLWEFFWWYPPIAYRTQFINSYPVTFLKKEISPNKPRNTWISTGLI